MLFEIIKENIENDNYEIELNDVYFILNISIQITK